MGRRNALAQLAALPLMMAAGSSVTAETPFLHGHALAEAGHSVQIFLLGEAVSLMRLFRVRRVLEGAWSD